MEVTVRIGAERDHTLLTGALISDPVALFERHVRAHALNVPGSLRRTLAIKEGCMADGDRELLMILAPKETAAAQESRS